METSPDTNQTDSARKLDILVDTIRISGFRGVRNLEVTLDQMTVLIGPNNSGKTTVLKALGLALGDYGRYVTEEDFYISIDSEGNEDRTDEIVVDIRIIPIGDDGKRTKIFEASWLAEFGDKIQAEANGQQFLAVKTKVFQNIVKGGYQTERSIMERWPGSSEWLTNAVKLTKMPFKIDSLPFFSIEAQRDIHSELKDKSSFVGKVLSDVKYDKEIIAKLEESIKEINEEAVKESPELQGLKEHLTQLNHTFQGTGTAEITPFPKKVRDLSKNFSIHFGETETNTFAMEYHGMGTRSWASMLTVQAFIDSLREKYKKEVKPFSPILAAEEPESHLHPNAQKTLYNQLESTNAQILVSTHSPYVAAMTDITNVRSLQHTAQGINISKLDSNISTEDKKRLSREIFARRGEILFSRALILCEGMTEEQVIPAMFEVFSGGPSLFDLGISCISVGGKKNYPPFVKLACGLGIPTFIISDNDGTTKSGIASQIQKLESKNENINLTKENFGISYCEDGNDFEHEIIKVLKIVPEVKEALISYETNASSNEQSKAAKRREIEKLSESQILEKLKESKTGYSGFLADVIKENANSKEPDQLVIKPALDAFKAIKGWLE